MIPLENAKEDITSLLCHKETIYFMLSGSKGDVYFTDKRIILVNFLGVTGLKKSVSHISYKHIVSFTSQSSGSFDLDTEIVLTCSHEAHILLQFNRAEGVAEISRLLAEFTL